MKVRERERNERNEFRIMNASRNGHRDESEKIVDRKFRRSRLPIALVSPVTMSTASVRRRAFRMFIREQKKKYLLGLGDIAQLF